MSGVLGVLPMVLQKEELSLKEFVFFMDLPGPSCADQHLPEHFHIDEALRLWLPRTLFSFPRSTP